MPRETNVTRCGNCGAALERRPGQSSLECAYCRQTTWLAPTTAAVPVAPVAPSSDGSASLHQRLLQGPGGAAHGAGVRYSPAQMASRDAWSFERGLWPSGAHASSTFGGSWSPSALLGPPRVYPRCGDIGGAWAPGPSRSAVEWVELEFAHELPVTAVRVFETNRPGSTFAVVDLTHGEQLLYEGMPRTESGARVLEVAVDPPRVVRRLRVYVVNPGWAEIDTVGLLAAAPLPEALRVRRPPPVRNGCLSVAAGLSIVAFALAVIGAAVWKGSARGPASGRAGSSSRLAPRPRPSVTVGQASIVRSPVDVDELMARSVWWASEVIGFSSEYSSTANAAAGVRFAPDVYPRHGDMAAAWASSETDAGEEWIEVRFASPVSAVSVLWLETFNAGAVTRVDDVTDPAAPAVLWEGAPTRMAGSVVAEVLLPARRTIGAVRLVLDSRAVPGWNEIDAIGLVPAP